MKLNPFSILWNAILAVKYPYARLKLENASRYLEGVREYGPGNILFFDSFEHVPQSEIGKRWESIEKRRNP